MQPKRTMRDDRLANLGTISFMPANLDAYDEISLVALFRGEMG